MEPDRISKLIREYKKNNIVSIEPHPVELYYSMKVTDEAGKIFSETQERPAHSFLFNFLGMLERMMTNTSGSIPITNTSGNAVTNTFANQALDGAFNLGGFANSQVLGIVVGWSGTGVKAEDFYLSRGTQNGTTSGQLVFNATTVNPTIYSGNAHSFTLDRSFTNNSQTSCAVNEIGVICKPHNCTLVSNNSGCVLIARDVVATTFVNSGQTLSVVYKLQTNA